MRLSHRFGILPSLALGPFLFGISYFACATPASAARNVTGATYVSTAAESRKKVLDYCRATCERNASKPRYPYRTTFEKALTGDFHALDTIFTNDSYHTNDMEWDLIPWHILHVLGDARYSSFVLSRPPSSRPPLLALQSPYVGVTQQAAFERYFRRKFPRTYALWATN
jgi:hypothetical protein